MSKEDYYGEYIIDRSYFPGHQADWQYNHYRFTISKEDEILFYITNGPIVIETLKGKIQCTPPNRYKSARIIIEMDEPRMHILESNPTTYRGIWDFVLVFHSNKFHNMYFKKGKWK